MKIIVVGLSHLGLVTGLGLASLGRQVISLDIDNNIVNQLKNNQISFYEPGLEELLKKHNSDIEFSSDFSIINQASLVFFSQDTATDGSGSIEKLEQLIDTALPFFSENVTIVCMSQVPIGYYRKLEQKIKNIRPNLKFNLYHLVDTIIMTNAIDRFINPERIIIGSSNTAKILSLQLKSFLKLFHCPIFFMSYESSELTKAAINLYLANTVTFANNLADFCEGVGANINEIIPALQTDKRIGPFAYLRPTLRISGGHLERDLFMLNTLAEKNKISSTISKWIIKSNNKRYFWALDKLDTYLFYKVKNPKICIWGLSYKKNTDSTINAASLKIIKDLNKRSRLKVYDPMAIMPKNISGYERFQNKYEALKDSHCLLILTEWDEFAKINPTQIKKSMKHPLIIDGVGILKDKFIKNKNSIYVTMGVGKNLTN